MHVAAHERYNKEKHCVHCGYKVDELRSQLASHLKKWGPYHDKKCEQCEVQFTSWEEHCSHVEREHGNTWKYRCGFCPDVFDGKGNSMQAKVVGSISL